MELAWRLNAVERGYVRHPRRRSPCKNDDDIVIDRLSLLRRNLLAGRLERHRHGTWIKTITLANCRNVLLVG